VEVPLAVAGGEASAVAGGEACAGGETRAVAASDPSRRTRARRRTAACLTWVGLAAAAAAAILCLTTGQVPVPGQVDPEHVMRLVREQDPYGADPDEWVPLSNSAPEGYPLDAGLAAGPNTRWRRLPEGLLGREGVVYELEGPQGRVAILFVVRLAGQRGAPEVVGLPRSPSTEVLATGGSTTSIWSDGGRMYVLLVPGTAEDLEAFLPDRGPLA
jgi:hypothetical protein